MIDVNGLVADFDTSRLLTLLGHYVCFQKKKKGKKEKKRQKKIKKEKVIKKNKKKKTMIITNKKKLLLCSFLVSLLFPNDTSRP